MKSLRIVAIAVAAALVLALGACAGGMLSLEELEYDDGSGGTYLKATAENGANGTESFSERALTVGEGDVIVLSPFTENGSFHVTITSSDDKSVAYEDDVSGRVLFSVGVAPGTYDVSVGANSVTGSMTIAVRDSAELAAENESLAEALKESNIDPNTVPTPDPKG